MSYLVSRTRAEIPPCGRCARTPAGGSNARAHARRGGDAELPHDRKDHLTAGRSSRQTCYFYPGLQKLEALGHSRLRFSVEADMGHDVWARVYAGRDLYDWLLGFSTRCTAP